MMQSQFNRKSAFEIFDKEFDPNVRYARERRKIYIDIREAVYLELTESGTCSLIDYFLEQYGPGSQYPFIPMVAVLDAMNAIVENTMLPVVEANYVRLENNCLPWASLPNVIVVPTANVRKKYWEIQRRHAARYARDTQQNYPQPAPLGNDANRVCRDAERDAEKIHRDAQNEAAKIRAAAESYANSIRREAEEYAEDLRNKADRARIDVQNEANQIRIDARNEAEEILEEAQHSREEILREAGQQAAREAQAEAGRLIGEKLQTYLQEQKLLWEEERQETLTDTAESCRAVAELKELACNQNTALGADMNRALEQLQQQLEQQLNQTRVGMLASLQQWRSSLYAYEYGPLVNVYLQLAIKAESFERDALKAQTKELTTEEARNMLAEHSISMNKLHNRMIRAMDKLGLRLFTPQPGELFNSEMHSVNDEEDDDIYLGRIIEECEKPGVERIANGAVSEILHRATVTLRPEADA